MRRQRLFAGILVVWFVVAVIIFLVFGQPMSGLIGFLSGGDGAPASGRIAFYSHRDGDHEIYVMDADGSGVVQLTDNGSGDYSPAWSPDGGHIAFNSYRDGDLGIYVMNADGSGVVRLADGLGPAWSSFLD